MWLCGWGQTHLWSLNSMFYYVFLNLCKKCKHAFQYLRVELSSRPLEQRFLRLDTRSADNQRDSLCLSRVVRDTLTLATSPSVLSEYTGAE